MIMKGDENCERERPEELVSMKDERGSVPGREQVSPVEKLKTCSQKLLFIDEIGGGRCGKVRLAVRGSAKYAVKIINKTDLVAKKCADFVYKEIKVLRLLSHPFVINCEFYHEDEGNLYIGMPYMPGGDLYMYIMFSSAAPSEEVARFYSAQIAMALEHLHALRVIHRDLKPENLMIDDEGYVKLIDFGSCSVGKDAARTFCGTCQYMAPEMLKAEEYGKSVDYWSLGVVVYELNAFQLPFEGDDVSLGRKITSGDFDMKPVFSSELKDLLKRLLSVDCRKRIGGKENDSESVTRHSWFRDVNFSQLYERKARPPTFSVGSPQKSSTCPQNNAPNETPEFKHF